MAVQSILEFPHKILRRKARKVRKIDRAINVLADDLADTLIDSGGVGLAANQIGLDMNLFIVDISGIEEDEKTRIFINGKIIDSRGESWFEEGCLSIPDIRLNVKRPDVIVFKYQDVVTI